MALFTKNLRKHIFVHPAQQSKLSGAIKSALLKDKKKFSDRLGGALLDALNLKVIGNRYLVVDGFLSMDVEADFQVFCPTVGMTLEGVVNKKSKGHIGCLVMDLFNASILIPPNATVSLDMGDPCEFTVTELIIDGDILSLRGTLSDAYYSYNENSVQEDQEQESKLDARKNVHAVMKVASNDDLFSKGVLTQTDSMSKSPKPDSMSKSPKQSKKDKKESPKKEKKDPKLVICDDINDSDDFQKSPEKKPKSTKRKSRQLDLIDWLDIKVKKEVNSSPSKHEATSPEKLSSSPSKKSKKSKNKDRLNS